MLFLQWTCDKINHLCTRLKCHDYNFQVNTLIIVFFYSIQIGRQKNKIKLYI